MKLGCKPIVNPRRRTTWRCGGQRKGRRRRNEG